MKIIIVSILVWTAAIVSCVKRSGDDSDNSDDGSIVTGIDSMTTSNFDTSDPAGFVTMLNAQCLACTPGQSAMYSGSQWVCVDGSAFSILGNLTCLNGQTTKFNGSDWVCADDDSFTASTSVAADQVSAGTSGSILVSNGSQTTWSEPPLAVGFIYGLLP